jgi:hypothetical protein
MPPKIYPRQPGLVVREQDGARIMQSMVLGFLKYRYGSFRQIGRSNAAAGLGVFFCAGLSKATWALLRRAVASVGSGCGTSRTEVPATLISAAIG